MNEESMYKYRVRCNGHLIASFQSSHQATTFVKERAAKFSQNLYSMETKKE